jgi:hypothetical protein
MFHYCLPMSPFFAPELLNSAKILFFSAESMRSLKNWELLSRTILSFPRKYVNQKCLQVYLRKKSCLSTLCLNHCSLHRQQGTRISAPLRAPLTPLRQVPCSGIRIRAQVDGLKTKKSGLTFHLYFMKPTAT